MIEGLEMKHNEKIFVGLIIIGFPFARFMDTNISQVADFMSIPYIICIITALVYGLLMFASLFPEIVQWE